MSKPEFSPEEIGHEPIESNPQNGSLLTQEKREQQIEIGASIAKLRGLRIKDISQMPEVMLNTFLATRRVMNRRKNKKK